ncbi:MAG: 50S ribosomal protein L3 [Clostridia bacterium]|nr:50S ribosomal protein L3 [Clostridia bacterium]MBR7062428.1 50S ribosomal protein L3 [Clostridia bacterium]
MKKFILGTKIGMTQIFAADGTCTPVTVVQAGPCAVVQKKTEETDGYCAVRVGYGETELKKLNKPERGVFEKLDLKKGYRFVKEFKPENVGDYEVGQEITVGTMFADGDCVDVRGTSKGKGYAGTIKRYGNKIGPITHGSKYHRGLGSMGPNTDPGRVMPGKHMPGHLGSDTVTVQNLTVMKVDSERGLLLIKGAVPGPKGALLEIAESVKA